MSDNKGGNPIGDEAIRFLHKFATLKELILWFVNITGKGIQILS